jgi:hypothetical protein
MTIFLMPGFGTQTARDASVALIRELEGKRWRLGIWKPRKTFEIPGVFDINSATVEINARFAAVVG